MLSLPVTMNDGDGANTEKRCPAYRKFWTQIALLARFCPEMPGIVREKSLIAGLKIRYNKIE